MIDDNCDDSIDESVLNTYYADNDGAGYGLGAPIQACTQPANTSTNDEDCDDFVNAVNPAATEVCNGGVDDDCDGLADNADPSVTGQTFFINQLIFSQMATRAVIADHQKMFAEGIQSLLTEMKCPPVKIVGVAHSLEELNKMSEFPIDLLILELSLTDTHGS